MSSVEHAARNRPVGVAGPVYVYGVAGAAPGATLGAGVGDRPVRTFEHGGLAALVSAVPGAPLRAKRRDLLRHTEVLQQAFARGTVLPLRFGTIFPSTDALVDELLAPRRDELLELLERFEGLGELRLRVYYEEEAVLAEIVREDRSIARLREATRGGGAADPRLVQLGEAVAHALAAKRRADGDALVAALAPGAVDRLVEEPQTEL